MLPSFQLKKVLINDPIDAGCIEYLEKAGIEVNTQKHTPEELQEKLKDYDALIVRSGTKVTAEIIRAAAPNLKLIGRAGTGVDNIDLKEATKHGILVMNTPGGNTISAAEHTMALLCAMYRNVQKAGISFKGGAWDRKGNMGKELFKSTIGIVGMGRIGREVAKRCRGFGMRVLGYDAIISDDSIKQLKVQPVTLAELFERSDVISVHTPLLPQTKNLINKDAFAKCKDGVRVVNCARGGIVDEDALLEALQSGKCGGAALDVFCEEPPKDIANHPLLQHPNVVITPHLGASTKEAQKRVAMEIATQFVQASKGQQIDGAVNAPAIRNALDPILKPWLDVAIQLGKMVPQLMDTTTEGTKEGHLEHLEVRVYGSYLAEHAKLVTSGVLSGLLSHISSDPVNLVNAFSVAEAKNIDLKHVVMDKGHDSFSNLIQVRYATKEKKRIYSATVFGRKAIKVVTIDDYDVEFTPRGHILFLRNQDQPGVAAKIGSLIAEASINISTFSLGRNEKGGVALTIVGVDDPIPDETVDKIRKTENVLYAKQISL